MEATMKDWREEIKGRPLLSGPELEALRKSFEYQSMTAYGEVYAVYRALCELTLLRERVLTCAVTGEPVVTSFQAEADHG
jgi:hypothetical protein